MRSHIECGSTWVKYVPCVKRTPTLRLPVRYGTAVGFDEGPLSSTREPRGMRVKIMSQQASAAAR